MNSTAKRKKKASLVRSAGFPLAVLAILGLVIAVLLRGTDVALFSPKGLVASEQHRLTLYVVGLMLLIAIPTLILFYLFAWRYRDSNEKAAYDPHARYSKLAIAGLWAIPIIMVAALATMMIPATHKLVPNKPIAADAKPLTIQVVAMRWKWLFIYPEQHIATVNFVQIPVGTPVQFELTADEAPMSSFWIPHLGGQLYAMTGHVNHLNLIADTAGDYPGRSAEINGPGFAGMKFTARASSQADFDTWAQGVENTAPMLDASAYKNLVAPSENNPAALYATTDTDLYDTVLMKYRGSHDHTEHNHMEHQ